MKSKMLGICSSVAVLQLLVGGSLLFTGCASTEEDRLPPGAYIPAASKDVPPPSNTTVVKDLDDVDAVQPKTVVSSVDEVSPDASKSQAKPVGKKDVKATDKSSVKSSGGAAATGKTTHVVKKGDTFWGLAAVYGVSMEDIAAANPSADPKKLNVGSKLVIPASSGKTSAKPAAKSASGAKQDAKKDVKKTTVKPLEAGQYIVVKGDSFARIASKFRIKAADLAAANNLSLEKPLQVGQKLTIPKAGEKVAKPANTASSKVKTPAKTEEVKKDVAPVPEAPALPADESTAEPGAPLASSAAVSAVSKDAAPAAAPATPGTSSYTTDVTEDTTLEELAKKYGFGVAELKKLNPEIPADGKVRAGSVVKLP